MIFSRTTLFKKIKNRIIFVTGGTGSFGKTIVQTLLNYHPKEIRIYSRSEDKQHKMQLLYSGNKTLKFILGDVRDAEQVNRHMSGVDFVFHAAAQKQVPASEYNVLEAIKTNIIGAQNVIDSCIKNRVQTAIAISTDKAVEPINAMGMTKALQEKLFIEADKYHSISHKTCFSCVRYGNVLGSTGSVLQVFLKCIEKNQDLTITNPEMTRFIITLKEAVDLVFTALLKSHGGEIFIPNLPSHTVMDLAETLLKVSGKKESLAIKKTGIRIGEKIHETLISESESLRTIQMADYFVILPHDLFFQNKKTIKKQISKAFSFRSDTAQKISTKNLEKLIADFLKDR